MTSSSPTTTTTPATTSATGESSSAVTITPSLSFPPETYKKVDPGSFLLRHLEPSPAHANNLPTSTNQRPSGRSPSEFRPATIHASSLSHAHGSAVVRTGDTAVVCGVRGEILLLSEGETREAEAGDESERGRGDEREEVHKHSAILKRHQLLVPNLELNTGCAGQFHPGPPSDLAQALTERLRRLLVETVCPVDVFQLRIFDRGQDSGIGFSGKASHSGSNRDVKAYWVLYIDTLMISLDGNPFDAAWACVIAALCDTKLPLAHWDSKTGRVLCDPVRTSSLQLRSLPFAASFGIFTAPAAPDGETATATGPRTQRWILADPDDFEQQVCQEAVLVVMRDEHNVSKLEKAGSSGSGGVGGGAFDDLRRCVEMAGQRWRAWRELIDIGGGNEK